MTEFLLLMLSIAMIMALQRLALLIELIRKVEAKADALHREQGRLNAVSQDQARQLSDIQGVIRQSATRPGIPSLTVQPGSVENTSSGPPSVPVTPVYPASPNLTWPEDVVRNQRSVNVDSMDSVPHTVPSGPSGQDVQHPVVGAGEPVSGVNTSLPETSPSAVADVSPAPVHGDESPLPPPRQLPEWLTSQETAPARISVLGGGLVLAGLSFTIHALGLPAWIMLAAIMVFAVVLYGVSVRVPWPVSGALRGLAYGVAALGIGSVTQRLPQEWGPLMIMGLLGVLSAALAFDGMRRREPLLGGLAVIGSAISSWMLADDLGRAGVIFLVIPLLIALVSLRGALQGHAEDHVEDPSLLPSGLNLAASPASAAGMRAGVAMILAAATLVLPGYGVAAMSHIPAISGTVVRFHEVMNAHGVFGVVSWALVMLAALSIPASLLMARGILSSRRPGLLLTSASVSLMPAVVVSAALGSWLRFSHDPVAALALGGLAGLAFWLSRMSWQETAGVTGDPEQRLSGSLAGGLTTAASSLAVAIPLALLGLSGQLASLAALAVALAAVGRYGHSRLWLQLAAGLSVLVTLSSVNAGIASPSILIPALATLVVTWQMVRSGLVRPVISLALSALGGALLSWVLVNNLFDYLPWVTAMVVLAASWLVGGGLLRDRRVDDLADVLDPAAVLLLVSSAVVVLDGTQHALLLSSLVALLAGIGLVRGVLAARLRLVSCLPHDQSIRWYLVQRWFGVASVFMGLLGASMWLGDASATGILLGFLQPAALALALAVLPLVIWSLDAPLRCIETRWVMLGSAGMVALGIAAARLQPGNGLVSGFEGVALMAALTLLGVFAMSFTRCNIAPDCAPLSPIHRAEIRALLMTLVAWAAWLVFPTHWLWMVGALAILGSAVWLTRQEAGQLAWRHAMGMVAAAGLSGAILHAPLTSNPSAAVGMWILGSGIALLMVAVLARPRVPGS